MIVILRCGVPSQESELVACWITDGWSEGLTEARERGAALGGNP
jgi:hypothetical protein